MAAVGNLENVEGNIGGIRFTKCGRTVIMSGIYTLDAGYSGYQVVNIGKAKYKVLYPEDIIAMSVNSSYINVVAGGYVTTDRDGIYLQLLTNVPQGLQIRVLGVYFTDV